LQLAYQAGFRSNRQIETLDQCDEIVQLLDNRVVELKSKSVNIEVTCAWYGLNDSIDAVASCDNVAQRLTVAGSVGNLIQPRCR
jgi:hypothetical protein